MTNANGISGLNRWFINNRCLSSYYYNAMHAQYDESYYFHFRRNTYISVVYEGPAILFPVDPTSRVSPSSDMAAEDERLPLIQSLRLLSWFKFGWD